ncbi:unnamed protein product, partial [Brassica rapa]
GLLGPWTRPWAKSRSLGAWVGLMTYPKPNQKGRKDASGRKGTTLGRWCPFASKSCLFVGQDLPSFSINMGSLLFISLSNSRVKFSEKNVERERESRPRDRPEKGRS